MNIHRDKFPLLNRTINGSALVYFDNAATALKPQSVIDAITKHYSLHSGNPGRSTHTLALESSEIIEQTRIKFLTYINGNNDYSAIFTKSATEAINLVAYSIGKKYRQQETKPTIIVSAAEHHSNFLPWLRLHQEENFPLVIIPVNENGTLDPKTILETIKDNPNSIIALTQGSNVTGQYIDYKEIAIVVKETNSCLLLDASQSIAHIKINLQELPIDYLVASAHKMYGPEGVGMLVVKKELLTTMTPLLLGGGMVDSVSTNQYTVKQDEEGFEAGTPNTAGIAGLSAAIDFLADVTTDKLLDAEKSLTQYILSGLSTFPTITVINDIIDENRLPLVSFSCQKVHSHDVADFLDRRGIAVRAGFHCAEPLHQAIKSKGSVRVSLSFYNTKEEIDYFIQSLRECLQKFE